MRQFLIILVFSILILPILVNAGNKDVLILPDTINHSAEIKIHNEQMSLWNIILPSLIAIVVSIIAFIGSMITVKSSQKSIYKQIQNAKENAELSFRQNVLSSNRVCWIQTFREKVSQLTTKMLFMLAKEEVHSDDLDIVLSNCTYIELMLNINDPKDQELVSLLRKVPKILLLKNGESKEDIGEIRTKIIEQTKIILKSEWERVKKGE